MSCSLQVCFILQTVVQPVGMEEHAIIHLSTVTVTVPVGTQDPTASTGVCIAAHTTSSSDPCTYTTVIHIVLQTVVLSVRMEECVSAD